MVLPDRPRLPYTPTHSCSHLPDSHVVLAPRAIVRVILAWSVKSVASAKWLLHHLRLLLLHVFSFSTSSPSPRLDDKPGYLASHIAALDGCSVVTVDSAHVASNAGFLR